MLGLPILYFKGTRLMMFQPSGFYCKSLSPRATAEATEISCWKLRPCSNQWAFLHSWGHLILGAQGVFMEVLDGDFFKPGLPHPGTSYQGLQVELTSKPLNHLNPETPEPSNPQP